MTANLHHKAYNVMQCPPDDIVICVCLLFYHKTIGRQYLFQQDKTMNSFCQV